MMLAAITLAACVAVTPGAGSILARDLAPAFRTMEGVAPDAVAGPAPDPGVRRFFTLSELRRLAARWKMAQQPDREICFERSLRPLDPSRLLTAMQRTSPGASIEILDYSRGSAPQGEIDFPRAGLRTGSSGTFWYGSIRYAGDQRYLIWAKVNLGNSPSQLVEASPAPAGPVDVRRGDPMLVGVRSGAALLEIQAQAASSGSRGQTVWVLNPANGKRFRARVEARGRVLVEADKP